MSIDIHVYDVQKLAEEIDKIDSGKELNGQHFLDKVMSEIGIVRNGLFIVQSADYWDEYSPWSTLISIIQRYYGTSEGYDILDRSQIAWKYDGAEIFDVWHSVFGDTEMPNDPDYEEEDDE